MDLLQQNGWFLPFSSHRRSHDYRLRITADLISRRSNFLHISLLPIHFGSFPMTTVARFIDISQSGWFFFNYKWPERRIKISRQNTYFYCIGNESFPLRTQRNLYYSLPDFFCLYSWLTASRDWWGYEFMTIAPKGSRLL